MSFRRNLKTKNFRGLTYEPDVLEYLWRLWNIAQVFPTNRPESFTQLIDQTEYYDDGGWICDLTDRAHPQTPWQFLRYWRRFESVATFDLLALKVADTLVMLYQHHNYYNQLQHAYNQQWSHSYEEHYHERALAYENFKSDSSLFDSSLLATLDQVYRAFSDDHDALDRVLRAAMNQVYCLAVELCTRVYGKKRLIPVSVLDPFVCKIETYHHYLTLAAELRSRLPMPARPPYSDSTAHQLLRLQGQTMSQVEEIYVVAAQHLQAYYDIVDKLH